jgi:hypothetical protein
MDEENPEEEKHSAKNLVLAIVIITAIFASIFMITYYFQTRPPTTLEDLHKQNLEGKETENNFIYNGFSFVKFDGLWYLQIQKNNTLFDIALRFSPREVEDIPIAVDFAVFDFDPRLHVTFDPYTTDATYQTLAAAELSLNLVKALGKQPYPACTRQDNDVCVNLPIVNCSYNFAPIVYLRQDEIPAVYQNNTCYVIQGTGFDLLKSVDRFLYKVYGIMP